jgi:hypothetical protein
LLTATAALIGAPPTAGERILPLFDLEPGSGRWTPPKKVTIAGQIWDRARWLSLSYGADLSADQRAAVFDIGGGWDLLETWLGTPLTRGFCCGRDHATVTIYLDGERAASCNIYPGHPALFFSVPVRGHRTLMIAMPKTCVSQIYWMNARLVQGRTTPSQPNDLQVADGELIYIERPGEYRIHVRR